MRRCFTPTAHPNRPDFAPQPCFPREAYYDAKISEFLLPYDAVRNSPDPKSMLLDFLQSTYEAAANLGKWDRAALERQP